MSSDEVFVTKKKNNKLSFDSQEEARLQAQQRQREQYERVRKQQKRRRKEQQARRIQQEIKKKQQQKQKYQNPQTMLIEDSDSKDVFERVERKIRKSYPDFKNREQSNKRRHISQSQSSQQQSDEESQSQESSQQVQKKKKVEKKVKKEKAEKKIQNGQKDIRHVKKKLQKVKIEEDDPKQKLIKQVAIRWWYCIPQWPPKNYPYEAQLKKLGYRLVQASQFRMEQNLVNGLYKVHAIEGFAGIFRSKLKLIDVRPNKQSAPSLRFLKSKSQQQLANLLKKALRQQYRQLSSQKYLLSEQTQLLTQIERRLNQLN